MHIFRETKSIYISCGSIRKSALNIKKNPIISDGAEKSNCKKTTYIACSVSEKYRQFNKEHKNRNKCKK